MGIKERKAREKEAMKYLIMDAGRELIQQAGIHNFTLRKLAETIEYSPATIYEYFSSKEMIIDALCARVCEELLEGLKKIDKHLPPEQYFVSLMRFHFDFLVRQKERVELMNVIFFGSDPSRIPKALLDSIEIFSKSLKRLDFPKLQTQEEIEQALDVLRTFLCGLLKIMESQRSIEGLARCQQILENSLSLMIQGWK